MQIPLNMRIIVIAVALSVLFTPIVAKGTAINSTPPLARISDLRSNPNGGRDPVLVSVGLYITNLASIDEARESFEIGSYEFLTWRDPRLNSESIGVPQSTLEYLSDKNIWTPPIGVANEILLRRQSSLLSVDRDDIVSEVKRFDFMLSNVYSLRKFPFDTQRLQIILQPFMTQESTMRFDPEPIVSGFSHDKQAGLAAWQLTDMKFTTALVVDPGTRREVPEARFIIEVSRRSGFYLWKVFLPMIIITSMSWSVFFLDVKDFDWEMKIPLATLLALVAFEFAIMRDLPRVAYITFLDAVFLLSYVFIFLDAVEITITYMLHTNKRRSLAMEIHRLARWAFPSAYALAFLILILCFFAGRQPVTPD